MFILEPTGLTVHYTQFLHVPSLIMPRFFMLSCSIFDIRTEENKCETILTSLSLFWPEVNATVSLL